ncbi:MAG: hypothetical protein ACF8PN_08860 [Phycisphaerales bacterium]
MEPLSGGTRRRRAGWIGAATVTVALALAMITTGPAGCAATSAAQAPTTMLRSVDLVRMTDLMAESLIASDVEIMNAVIVADRVVNRTNHIMEPGEKELFVARLRRMLNESETLAVANVRFVAAADDLADLTEAPGEDATGVGPTHALTATFRTLTTVTRRVRDDAYVCAFQLQNLRTREVVWEDAYEVRFAVERGKFQ